MTEQNEELPVVAVRTKYENSPYGWSYHEDAKYGKYSDAKREKLYRQQDVQQLIEDRIEDVEEAIEHAERTDNRRQRIAHAGLKAGLEKLLEEVKTE